MAKILDYHCSYDSASGLGQWAEVNKNLSFPEAYEKHEMMAELARTICKHDGAAFCLLPFCHTLEAEALGADIFPGDSLTGPRARKYICKSLQEIAELTMDFASPRLQETLEALRKLRAEGEHVLFQISGPLTILNSLLPSEILFRALRKEPEKLLYVFRLLGAELLRLTKLAEEAGAELISYAEPMGGVSIIGPKSVEMITRGFTADFLRNMDEQLEPETLVLLCPKTAFALLGTELAQWKDHPLDEKMKYGAAALSLRGSLRFGGQSCVKRAAYETDIFKEVRLQFTGQEDAPRELSRTGLQ